MYILSHTSLTQILYRSATTMLFVRHEERRFAFDVDGLRRFAAESVNPSQCHADVVSLSKLAEGGFNRNFLNSHRFA